MSTTPRTDRAYYVVKNPGEEGINMVTADFARELERELAVALTSCNAEELRQVRADLVAARKAMTPLLRHRPDGDIGWRGRHDAKCGDLLVSDILRIEKALGREYADKARATLDAAKEKL